MPRRIKSQPVAGVGELRCHWIDEATLAWPADLAGGLEDSSWELWSDPDAVLGLSGGIVVGGSSCHRLGSLSLDPKGLTSAQLTNRKHLSSFLALKLDSTRAAVEEALRGQVVVVQFASDQAVTAFTGVQIPGVLDDLYATAAKRAGGLGPRFGGGVVSVKVWAPTARNVDLLIAAAPGAREETRVAMQRGADGTWSVTGPPSWNNASYLFEVTVFSPAQREIVVNRVTDPYSTGLTLNSKRSVLVDLSEPRLAPELWIDNPAPRLGSFVDRAIYELHIRDFSATDQSVPEALRGTYEAFTLNGTDGVARLTELAEAGMNTVHLLPSFDIATIEEDRDKQAVAVIPDAGPASRHQQAAVMALADRDAFNWGYDPYHYFVPEGSYAASGRQSGGRRTASFREMVGGLHRAGFQVVLDQVFNHTSAAGQADTSVLDKIVPGYYHRLDLSGAVETSTCCHNIATEHEMAEQLMVDAVVSWARWYRVDGFRFDLMGHHSVSNMLAVRAGLDALTIQETGIDGASIYLYGEGWNFGEVADNARFRQATQGQLDGTRIGSFNDRIRDAVHGGGPLDESRAQFQGFATGLFTDPNGVSSAEPKEQLAQLRHCQDLIRLGLAGNLKDFGFETAAGRMQVGSEIDFNGREAGFASEPDECVNYVDAHDNETLFDICVWKLPAGTAMADRIAMNTLALATVTLGQAPSFWHAGTELLRSKSLDRNSFNSGDHFNRIDWTMRSNNFGVGLPPAAENQARWAEMVPFLSDRANRPAPAQLQLARAQALRLLRLRKANPLLRLGSAKLIKQKVTFPNAGAEQRPGLILMRIDDTVGVDVDPRLDTLLVGFNASPSTITVGVDGLAGVELWLTDALGGAEPTASLTRSIWRRESGTLQLPPRCVVVLEQPSQSVARS